jgi:hypothetical protein
MNQWVATTVYGSVMGVQAGLIAIGRAGIPVVVGVMHDALDTYTLAIALLTGLLAVASLLVGSSGYSSPDA